MEQTEKAKPVSLAYRFVQSPAFGVLFAEGMQLVEDSATYLDGLGRQESKKLDRFPNRVYATETMRLTTRLMKIASWLLLMRAVKEGEMPLESALKDKDKIRSFDITLGTPDILALPAALQALIERANVITRRLNGINRMMNKPVPAADEPEKPVIGARALRTLLRGAFS